jgi:hypothetical protein
MWRRRSLLPISKEVEERAARKVLRNHGLLVGHTLVKAAASRRTPKQARVGKYFWE